MCRVCVVCVCVVCFTYLVDVLVEVRLVEPGQALHGVFDRLVVVVQDHHLPTWSARRPRQKGVIHYYGKVSIFGTVFALEQDGDVASHPLHVLEPHERCVYSNRCTSLPHL